MLTHAKFIVKARVAFLVLHCYNRNLVGFTDVSATEDVHLDNSKILLNMKMEGM